MCSYFPSPSPSYSGLANFYNRFIGEVNYSELASFASKFLNPNANAPVLDAACGTGTLTILLRSLGFDMIGLDISEEMLSIAGEAAREAGWNDILWLCQDMSYMDLFGTVSGILCTTDSINHIMSEAKLSRFFKRAYLFTEPGGFLIFDALTESHYTGAAARGVFFEDFNDCSCFWTCKYSTKTRICKYDISCFECVNPSSQMYCRHDDYITEKFYDTDSLVSMLKSVGYSDISVYGNLKCRGIRENDARRYYVCRRAL